MKSNFINLSFIGYPQYKVGNDGSVWSNTSGKWKLRKPQPTRSGHLMVILYKHNKEKGFYVHRLVLLAFVGPCPEGMESRHFPDRDPTNNNLTNLSWGTQAEQYLDKDFHGTVNRGERNGSSVLTEGKVRRIRRLYRTGKYSQYKLARKFKCSQDTIGAVCRRKRWKHVK